jgi:hypothetical protein
MTQKNELSSVFQDIAWVSSMEEIIMQSVNKCYAQVYSV